MTEKTIQPEKWIGKKKSREIQRFLQFMTAKNLNPEIIQQDTGVSVRTITNSIYEDNPLGAKILRQCHLKYGLSIDWVLSGIGQMFITQHTAEKITENPAIYVANNDRLARIIAAVDQWMLHASDDEKTWLEIDIRQKLIKNWPPMGEDHD